MALFESLPGNAGIKHKIELRALDLSKINDNDTRNQYAEAKALVALDPVEDDWW